MLGDMVLKLTLKRSYSSYHESCEILSRLSGERLRHEFDLIFEEQNPSAMLHHLAELHLLDSIHGSLQHANFQLPFINILPEEFGEITIPDILSFKRTLGWILWLMPLSMFDIEVISRRLDFPALLAKSSLAASRLLAELPSLINWTPSQWTFYLEEIPSIAVYAVYLMRWRLCPAAISGELAKDQAISHRR